MTNLDWEGPAIGGKELKGPLGWVEAATPEGCGHQVEWFDEVWVHGMWLPKEWAACRRVLKAGKRLVRMTHGSLSPVYLKRQSPFKKWLVGPIERYWLRKADRIVATCDAEKAWIEAYLGKKCPEIVVTDIKRFFDFSRKERKEFFNTYPPTTAGRSRQRRCPSRGEAQRHRGAEKDELHLLYLGRRHPLKGVEFLEVAVFDLHSSTPPLPTPPLLKIVSNAFGEEKEKVWAWCDVLVLPTLSENFGLVVAEALERGKKVITTDGAPVWGEGVSRVERVETCREGEIMVGYGGRLIYLKGYREGTKETRVELLKAAIEVVGDGIGAV